MQPSFGQYISISTVKFRPNTCDLSPYSLCCHMTCRWTSRSLAGEASHSFGAVPFICATIVPCRTTQRMCVRLLLFVCSPRGSVFALDCVCEYACVSNVPPYLIQLHVRVQTGGGVFRFVRLGEARRCFCVFCHVLFRFVILCIPNERPAFLFSPPRQDSGVRSAHPPPDRAELVAFLCTLCCRQVVQEVPHQYRGEVELSSTSQA